MTLASEVDLPTLLTRERHRIHLVGVAGSGMSGIAALLLELGHDVSGSDKVGSLETDRLQRLGLRFHAPASRGRRERCRTGDLFFGDQEGQSDPGERARSGQTARAPRRSAGRDHVGQTRNRHRGHAWQDDDFRHGGACFARGRSASVPLCWRGNSAARLERALGSARRVFCGGRR